METPLDNHLGSAWSKLSVIPQSVSSVLQRGVIISTTGIVAKVVNVLTVGIIVRTIGEAKYGVYQYHLSLAMTAAVFGLFGTNALLFREFSVSSKNACRWLYHGLVLRNIGEVLAFSVLLVVVWLASLRVSALLLAIVFVVAYIELNIQLNSSWYKALRKPWLDFLYTVTRGLLVLAAVLSILSVVPNEFGVAFGYFIGGFVVLAAIFLGWWRALKVGRKVSFEWGSALWESSTIVVLEVLGVLYTELPIILLGAYGTFSEVGFYAVYYRFLSPFNLPCISYDQAFQPDLNRLVRTNQRYGTFLRSGLISMALIGVVSAFVMLIVGPFAIKLFANQAPVNWKVVAAFLPFPVVSGYAAMLDNSVIALQKQKYIIISHASGVVALILTFLLGANLHSLRSPLALLVGFSTKAAIAAIILKSLGSRERD